MGNIDYDNDGRWDAETRAEYNRWLDNWIADMEVKEALGL